MIIQRLKLHDFRNYGKCEVNLHPKLNIFLGNNAQGKTNIIESIVYLSTTRSFRNVLDLQLIKHDCMFAAMEATILDLDDKKKVKAVLSENGRSLFYQNQPMKKSSEFIGILNAIIFSPSDLDLFESSPKKRRRFMDFEIGKIRSIYLVNLNHYLKLLKERNQLLKQENVDLIFLEVLTKQMVDLQVSIIQERVRFITVINHYLEKYYEVISNEKVSLRLNYETFVDYTSESIKDLIIDKYEKSLNRDLLFKQTHIGVHKDDFIALLNSHDITSVASQGQKRMIILSMKISLIPYIYHSKKKLPILLLDDVLSELDYQKRINLFRLIPNDVQTIITTTDIEEIEKLNIKEYQVYYVDSGSIYLDKEDFR